MNKSVKRFMIVFLSFMIIICAFSFFSINKNVYALNDKDFVNIEGASIRVDSKTGIRFKAVAGKDFITRLKEEAKEGEKIKFYSEVGREDNIGVKKHVDLMEIMTEQVSDINLTTTINYGNLTDGQLKDAVKINLVVETKAGIIDNKGIVRKEYTTGVAGARSMRGVANSAYLNYTGNEAYQKEELTKYLGKINEKAGDIEIYSDGTFKSYEIIKLLGKNIKSFSVYLDKSAKAYNVVKSDTLNNTYKIIGFDFAGKTDVPMSIFDDNNNVYNYNLKVKQVTVLNQENIDLLKTPSTGNVVSGKYILSEDIDLGGKEWVTKTYFNGMLDGQGHTIKNLTLTSTVQTGLLGVINGNTVVKNLAIVNATTKSNSPICFRISGGNVTLENVFVDIDSREGTYTSGLVGYHQTGTLTVRNVFVNYSTNVNADLQGLISAYQGRTQILDGFYGVCENSVVGLHSKKVQLNSEGKPNLPVEHLGIDNSIAVKGKDYYIHKDVNEFYNSMEYQNISSFLKKKFEETYKVKETIDDATHITKANIRDLELATTGKYVLDEDIDMADIKDWGESRVGTKYGDYRFNGIFDGQGHTIKNLNTGTDGAFIRGLFYSVNGATIKNVRFENATIAAIRNGLIAGRSGNTKASVFENIVADITLKVNTNVGFVCAEDKSDIFKNVLIYVKSDSKSFVNTSFTAGVYQSLAPIVDNLYCVTDTTLNEFINAPATGTHKLMTLAQAKAIETGSLPTKLLNDALVDILLEEGVDTTNAPDYSESNKQFGLWAYGSTCDDWYMLNDKKYYFNRSLQTPESIKLYKEAGFTSLYIDWTFQENSLAEGYNFNNGKLKYVLDLAYDEGLKCVIFQPNIYNLSNCEELRINPEKADGVNFFADEKALEDRITLALTGLKDHPAFGGVVLSDEPNFKQLPATGEVFRAFKKVCPDSEVVVNLLPLADSLTHKGLYTGSQDVSIDIVEAYKIYLTQYYNQVGKYSGYIQYDDYPLLDNGVLSTYIKGSKIVSDFAKEKGLERRMVQQTTTYADRRSVNEADLWWQNNISMAMGNKEFSYYTYYPTVNVDGQLPDETAFIVDRTGKPNPKYYSLKKIHEQMQFNAKALMNFEYQGMTYLEKGDLSNSFISSENVMPDQMKFLTKSDFNIIKGNSGTLLVTELYDKENNRYGYYVVNATDPASASEIEATLTFGQYKQAQIYKNGYVANVGTDNGTVKVNLGVGQGAFIMPY